MTTPEQYYATLAEDLWFYARPYVPVEYRPQVAGEILRTLEEDWGVRWRDASLQLDCQQLMADVGLIDWVGDADE